MFAWGMLVGMAIIALLGETGKALGAWVRRKLER